MERYSYDVFGDPNRTSSVGNPYLFTGRRYDNESGLYYYRARYYKPSIGRFLQTDPIGYAAGLNMYTYCGNDPLNWIDPWGLRKEEKDLPIITENDLLDALRVYNQFILSKMKTPFPLFLGRGDTDRFYVDDLQYRFVFMKGGREHTIIASGKEMNYIGVGAGFKKFHLTPFMPFVAPQVWNIFGRGRLAPENKIRFAVWGYTHYNIIEPHSDIHKRPIGP